MRRPYRSVTSSSSVSEGKHWLRKAIPYYEKINPCLFCPWLCLYCRIDPVWKHTGQAYTIRPTKKPTDPVFKCMGQGSGTINTLFSFPPVSRRKPNVAIPAYEKNQPLLLLPHGFAFIAGLNPRMLANGAGAQSGLPILISVYNPTIAT